MSSSLLLQQCYTCLLRPTWGKWPYSCCFVGCFLKWSTLWAVSWSDPLQDSKVSKVKLATIVEGDPKAPFSVATTPRCAGATPFPGLLHFTLDPYLIMLSVKQGDIKNYFWVFGMIRPSIEPWSPRQLVNTLLIRQMTLVRVFANGPGGLGSIPGGVIPKT